MTGLQSLGQPSPLPMPTPGPPCPQCRCRPGFRLKDDGRTCADMDECSTTFPCSQRCINTHGSYKCLCVEGYAPRGGDPHSCKAVTGEMGVWGCAAGPGHLGEWWEDGSGGLTPLSPPSELQEIPVAIREQSGVLCFHSR